MHRSALIQYRVINIIPHLNDIRDPCICSTKALYRYMKDDRYGTVYYSPCGGSTIVIITASSIYLALLYSISFDLIMALPYKCVLMVGATSGIGLGMAEKLISKGSKVVVVGRRKDRLDEFVRKHGKTKAGAVPFDITNTKGMSSFVDTVTSNYPDLDCLFLNAGTQGVHDFSKPEKVDLTAFHEEMNVNFASYVNISAAFLPFLQSKPSATSIVM